MFKKILIANRSEIALRILRTCREMGIETVAIYSTADKDALHVSLADEAICVGSEKASESYLNMKNIMSTALLTGCDAIHPAFGFLSENSDFARVCARNNIKFIGPDADIIDKMGNKSQARELMIASGVPVVPGSNGSLFEAKIAHEIADEIGYPVLVKASAGGGGRGMRKVFDSNEFEREFNNAQTESVACFGSNEMYIEKLILNPKHIEFQILADEFGHIVHLGERDCSVQRRNQKMIEESPSKSLTPELREKMSADAIKAAKAANYTNAGTIEFVLDADGNYYFIEMNTRIQVEHPVTEMITGTDLIREQIRVAAGLKLNFTQEDIVFRGHAIECRINAENPWGNFAPSIGEIKFLHLPSGNGVRVDSALYQGYTPSPFYDSMVAKIIVSAPTRLDAIKKMRRCLEELIIDGFHTNAELLHFILFSPEFVKGNYNTGFIEANFKYFEQAKDKLLEK
ncbi:MAG: acetyl-CoA carboxylase biotin carboxylase subunit [Clostridia bacterium]